MNNLFMFFVSIAIIGALFNGVSIATIGFVLILGFILYNVGNSKGSLTDLAKENTKSTMLLDNMVKDFSYVTSCIADDNKEAELNLGTIARSTNNVIDDTKSIMK